MTAYERDQYGAAVLNVVRERLSIVNTCKGGDRRA